MKSYNEIIRELREDNDKTQKEIADYLGTTQQVYSRYEKGKNKRRRADKSDTAFFFPQHLSLFRRDS